MVKIHNLIWYNPVLKDRARELRNNCTKAELLLWKRLKGKQVRGYHFRRQRPIFHFIVDFYCQPLKLAIELDGSIHDLEEVAQRDAWRQELLMEFGITFLRFRNEDAYNRMDEVVAEIENCIDGLEQRLGGS